MLLFLEFQLSLGKQGLSFYQIEHISVLLESVSHHDRAESPLVSASQKRETNKKQNEKHTHTEVQEDD